MEVRLISSVDRPHDSENWQTQPALESWAKKCFGCAAHQVPHVTQRLCVNFYGSISSIPANYTLYQFELKTLVKPLQSNMHDVRRRISVFINCCTHVHSCVYICVCVTKGGCLIPNRCHYFPLTGCHLSMSTEVFLLFCLCYFVCVCVCLCMRMRTWMGVCYIEEGSEACVYVGGWVCVWVIYFTKMFLSQEVPDSFWCILVSWGVRKSSFPTKISATKKLGCIKCHSVEGIGSSHWHKYNLSSRSGASFWINSVCGMTVYEAGRQRAYVLEGGMGFALREKRWHDQLHQQKACRRC